MLNISGAVNTQILKELKEIKTTLNKVVTKQGELEKTIAKIDNKLSEKTFDLAKFSHAVSIIQQFTTDAFRQHFAFCFIKFDFSRKCNQNISEGIIRSTRTVQQAK